MYDKAYFEEMFDLLGQKLYAPETVEYAVYSGKGGLVCGIGNFESLEDAEEYAENKGYIPYNGNYVSERIH